MDQLICASLSHTHNWYEVGMLKVPAYSMWGEKCSRENDCWVTARGNEETEQIKRELSCSEQKRGESYTIQGCKKHATRTTMPTTTQYSHLHEQHRQFQLVPGD